MPTPPLFDGLAELLTITEAAAALHMHPKTIRKAITTGDLKAFTVAGREPLRSGRGLGYRIRREDLQAWYFGAATVEP